MMREFEDETGAVWQAIAVDAVVAHGKPGSALAFRPADQTSAEPLPGNITFNSEAAADFALRTMGTSELRRRLSLARSVATGNR